MTDVLIANTPSPPDPNEYSNGPTLVALPGGVLYLFYVRIVSGDYGLWYSKSTDRGVSWGSPILIVDTNGEIEQRITGVEVWFDKWTPGLTGTMINIVVGNAGLGDNRIDFLTLNTVGDVVSSLTKVFDLFLTTGQAGRDKLSITRDKDGNYYVVASSESVAFKAAISATTAWSGAADFTSTTSVSGVAGEISPSSKLHLVPGFDDDKAVLITLDVASQEIRLLEWNTVQDQFDAYATLDTGVGSFQIDDTEIAVSQRDGDHAIFVAYAMGLSGTDEIRCAFVRDRDTSSFTVLKTFPAVGFRSVGVFTDWVLGHVYVSYCVGATATTLQVFYRLSVNSAAVWETEVHFDDDNGSGRNYKRHTTVYCNFDDVVTFTMAWWWELNESWYGHDDNQLDLTEFRVREPASGQEIVSCLTGNPPA